MYKHKSGIRFRKVDESHLEELLKIKEETWWGTHSYPLINPSDQKRWFQNLNQNNFVMVGLKKEDFVGFGVYSSINWMARTCDISGTLSTETKTSGRDLFACGTDFAFEVLNMHRLNAEVLECNLPAFKIETEFLEFKVEGRKRQAVYKSGKYYDSLVLGLLREDWENSKRVKELKEKTGTCNYSFDFQKFDRFQHQINQKCQF